MVGRKKGIFLMRFLLSIAVMLLAGLTAAWAEGQSSGNQSAPEPVSGYQIPPEGVWLPGVAILRLPKTSGGQEPIWRDDEEKPDHERERASNHSDPGETK